MVGKHDFRAIDGLKGVFIFFIVVMHVQGAFDYAFMRFLRPVYAYGGYLGNYMFFILSGFLMGYWYSQRIMDDDDGRTTFLDFLKKRLLKIYPLYFLTNVVAIVIDLIQQGSAAIDIRRMLLTFLMMSTGWVDDTYVPYNGVGWFVNVLMVCYILFFFVCRIGRKNRTVFLAALIICCLIGHAFMMQDLKVPFCFRTNGEGYLNFFLGVLLAQWYKNRKEGTSRQAIGWICLGLDACILAVSAFVGGISNVTSDIPTTISLFCVLLVIAAFYAGGFRIVMGNPVFAFLGRISMSIFLWHLPLLNILQGTGGLTRFNNLDLRIQFFAFLAVTILVSVLSHKFLEPRIESLFRKVIKG